MDYEWDTPSGHLTYSYGKLWKMAHYISGKDFRNVNWQNRLTFCWELRASSFLPWPGVPLESWKAGMGWCKYGLIQLSFAAVFFWSLLNYVDIWDMTKISQAIPIYQLLVNLMKIEDPKFIPWKSYGFFQEPSSISASRCSPASWWHDPLPESPDRWAQLDMVPTRLEKKGMCPWGDPQSLHS